MSGDKAAVRRRSAARLAAVQALYEMDLSGADWDPVLAGFLAKRWQGDGIEPVGDPDPEFLAELLRGTAARMSEVDALIEPTLSGEWTLDRLEAVIRAILRAGTFELLARADVPVRVVISEYVDVAHAFFLGKEAALVNGVLDRLARSLRADEAAEMGREPSR